MTQQGERWRSVAHLGALLEQQYWLDYSQFAQ
jgi:hypothetical protein